MIPLDEVQATIVAAVEPLPPVEHPLADALGLVLATDVVSRCAVPPFANTAMDGYAVRAADTVDAGDDTPVRLRVIGDLPAGRAPTIAVGDGEAIRIMTGAPMPEGADAIVMVERTERDGDDAVLVYAPAAVGDHVRPAGGDLEKGELVFPLGTALGPAHLGVLASIDVHRVPVYPRVRVGVLSTGDELVESGPRRPGQDPRLQSTDAPRAASRGRDGGDRSRDRARRRGGDDRGDRRRPRTLRRGDHQWWRVRRRLRLRERGARTHRGRRSRPARVSTGTKWRSDPRSPCASRSRAGSRCSGSPATRCRRS